MVSRSILHSLVTFLLLMGVGCNGPPVHVAQSAPSERWLTTQILDVRNCSGNTDLQISLGSKVQVSKQVTIADQAISTQTGKSVEISPEMRARLSAEVERTYRQRYAEANSIAEQTILMVPMNRIRMFKIHWNRQLFTSSVSFSMDDETCTASYTYALDTPKLEEYSEISCTA